MTDTERMLRDALREATTAAGHYRDRCDEAAAFLDNLATLMGYKTGHGKYDADVLTVVKWAADCRAMAKKLRGERDAD